MIEFDRVTVFDDAVDDLLERFRGDPVLDRIMTTATRAGEFSLLWHAASVLRGAARRRPDQIVALAVGIAAESLVVNQVLKRLFRRERPTSSGDDRFELRTPLTSSFPSGHASAATFAAVCLIGWDGKKSAIVWMPLAAAVAVSRPYVRIHHASDVVGGVVIGGLLGLVAKRVFRRIGVT
ncbi:MAG: phosphatase PAP2 family protein [Ilumatobacteraceae bacterium]